LTNVAYILIILSDQKNSKGMKRVN